MLVVVICCIAVIRCDEDVVMCARRKVRMKMIMNIVVLPF